MWQFNTVTHLKYACYIIMSPLCTQRWGHAALSLFVQSFSVFESVCPMAEWILASIGDAGPTFNRHWVGVGLYSPPAVCTAKPAFPDF